MWMVLNWRKFREQASSLENEIRIRNELDKFMKQPHINNTKLRQVKAVHCRRRKPKAEQEHWSNLLNCEQ